MLAIVEERRAELFAPGEDVDVYLRRSPLRQQREHVLVPAGLSIAEIIEHCEIEPSRLYVTINGHSIEFKNWARVRVKPGANVSIVKVPGKGALRSILGVVIAIAAVFLAPVIGAAIGGFFGTSAGIGLIGAGITMAGSLAVNALFPVAKPQQQAEDKTKTLYSIGGSQNESAQYGAVPEIFGVHRISPPYAAGSYTEIIGDDQYLRMLFCVGYGPISISDLQIAETPISKYEGVSVEVIADHLTQSPTLYTKPVYEEAVSVLLDYASSWVQRTTAENVDEISVDVSFPNGVYQVRSSNGQRVNYTVTIEIQYAPAGTGAWSSMGNIVITSSSAQAIRRSANAGVVRGQYDVRMRKVNPDNPTVDDTISETAYWTALRGRRNEPVIKFSKPLTLIALRIKATNELNGTVNQLNCFASPLIRSWNGFTWVADQITRNPADHFRQVLQGNANARPVADSGIDLQSLQDWHAFNVANGFTYDKVCSDQVSVYDRLTEIAAAGRASVSFRDGKWGVVWDVAGSDIVQHFTPRNSSGFSSVRAYADLPHGFRVNFINRTNNYLNDERVVYDDGYSEANATKFEGLDFPGVTDPNLIWRHGRYHIAQLRLQRETYSLTTDFEHLVCTRGDRVRVNHDVVLWGLGAARVKAVSAGGVTLDDTLPMEAGKTYSMRFRLATGGEIVRTVAGIDGEFTQFTFSGTGSLPAVGDLVQFGENGMESVVLRVKSITPQADLSAKLELVDDAPGILNADKGAIPEFVTGMPPLVDYRSYTPMALSSVESIWTTAPPTSAVRLSWLAPEVGKVTNYIIQYAEKGSGNWINVSSVSVATADITDLPSGAYDVRIRAVFTNSQLSGWLTGVVTASIFDAVPADVTGFKIAVTGDVATLQWDPLTEPTISHFEVRFSPVPSSLVTWQTASLLRSPVIGQQAQFPPLVGTYLIKAVSYSGLQSATPALIVNTIDGLTLFNAVELVDEVAPFPGVKNGTYFDGSALRLDVGSDYFEPADFFSPSDFFLSSDGYQPVGYYSFANMVDLSETYNSRVTSEIHAFGEWSSDDFFAQVDVFSRADYFGGIGSQWDASIEMSTTADDPTAVVTRASTGTYFDADGLLKTAANNVPRWNYNPSDLSALPVLLAEPAGTNLLQRSSGFDNAYWGKTRATITADAVVAPDGTMTADKLVEDTSASTSHFISKSFTPTATGETNAFAIFLKKGERRYAQVDFGLYANQVSANFVTIDLETGAYTAPFPAQTFVQALPDGWFKVGTTTTSLNGLGLSVRVFMTTALSSGTNYTGDGVSGIYIWGGQLEVGNAPSSYIPTTTASVTRAAETIVSQPTWTDWSTLVTGDVLARAYKFRAKLETKQADVTPVVTSLAVSIDMPDRVTAGNDLVVPPAGLSISFSPAYKKLQGLSIASQGMVTGDTYDITGKTEAGFTIAFKNAAGVGVTRTFDYVAKGYGRLQ